MTSLDLLLPIDPDDEYYGDHWVAAWFDLPEDRRPAPGLDVWWSGR